MPVNFTTSYLEDALAVFRQYKKMAEDAIAQVSDADLDRALDADGNSIAVLVKHMVGNMRSRWTDFLTTDGEKPDRNRESEFEQAPATRAALMALWDDGWRRVFAALEPLSDADLSRAVVIRGERHAVMQAIQRQVAHYAAHAGQIVLLAKHFRGAGWQTLSLPRRRTLESRLSYTPRELQFGTSGRRGLVVDLTQLEIYINVRGELAYLMTLASEDGGIHAGQEIYFAGDLRPSSASIAQAVVRAILDAGFVPVNLGELPTPALTYFALARSRASIMVTGSHIPFDRNGYKLNTSRGELLKQHEAPINASVRRTREQIYSGDFADSLFNERGLLKDPVALPEVNPAAREFYLERYTGFFTGRLDGKRVVLYQHSAVGRDLLAELLRRFGADVVPAGRSETFVPIDTENIGAEQLETIQELADARTWAVVSTDGDSDRPLILGVEGGKVRFFGGDLVGMIVAEFLGADAVVVPISTNDAIDRGKLANVCAPKTRIGSPYVIAGMEESRASGRSVVCGWEANGGFLVGSDVTREGRTLKALATRDAFLPIVCVLLAAAQRNVAVSELFAELPKRYSRAALLKNFPRPLSLRILELTDFSPFFTSADGFGPIARYDRTDGVRIVFENGEIAHVRPSGNADELRIYAVADTEQRANEITALGIAEPDGILRRLEHAVQ